MSSASGTSTTIRVVGPVDDLFRSPEHARLHGSFEATVAICFANNEETLPETIASLHWQENPPSFELLLVTNGTTDTSVALALEASRGLAVRLVGCESVGYDANARNVALQEAASSKVVFLDADDVADCDFVRAMSSALDDAAVVTASWDLGRLNGETFPGLDERSRGPDLPFDHRGWTFAPAGTIGLRRGVADQVGGFAPELSFAANNEWCFRAFAAGHRIQRAEGATVHYRLRRSLPAAARQHYRWGLWEVAAIECAHAYGLPRTGLRLMLSRWFQVLRTVPSLGTPYGRFAFVGGLSLNAGLLVGRARLRGGRLHVGALPGSISNNGFGSGRAMDVAPRSPETKDVR